MKILPPRQGSIVALTLLAVALGGSTELGAQAALAALTGALILMAPPQRSLGRLPGFLFIALLGLALAAYLPADWSAFPPWRHHLVEDLHAPLASTRTPQPWLTLEACCLFFIGLVWAYYVLTQTWDNGQRLQAVHGLVLGVSILAAVAVAAYGLGFHVPGWNQEQNRGWFPNRNQTADVLALCGILNYALIVDRLRKGHSSGYLWMAALVPIGAALVVSYSRSGILMFFGGICLWHLWPSSHRKSVKRTTLTLALILTLLTLFLVFGGETLERFQTPSASPVRFSGDFRLLIQRDAFRFSLQSPWLGVGLGNFGPLFAAARQASVDQNRAIHPESDWLWAACELGWLAPLLFIAGIWWWLKRCFPFQAKPGESLRRALAVAGVMFVLHGFVDVSGHRIGSMWVALLVAALAMPSSVSTPPWRGGPLVFRCLAGGLLVMAAWWWASLLGARVPPTSATLARLESSIVAEDALGQVEAMGNLSDEALQIAPLNWTLYFQRAYAEAYQRGKLAQALADFQTARALEPHWVNLCFNEGSIWLAVNQPDNCLDAWQEALRRASGTGTELDDYRQMLDLSAASPVAHEELGDLAARKLDYQLVFLAYASPKETKRSIDHLLVLDPELRKITEDQRRLLFDAWWMNGDRKALVARLLTHENWQNSGWPYLAKSYAEAGNFQQAWETVARHAPAPAIPAPATDQSVADLKRDFYGRTDNLASGLMLVLAEIKADETDEALTTVQAVEKLPDHPKYIFYLEARLWAQKQQWDLAWQAWSIYSGM